MPKLDGTHLPERLAERLSDLKEGIEVAVRDIKALLSDKQIEEMETAWSKQQILRKEKRARTKEEELALGWKSKREIYIEAYERALDEANNLLLKSYEERLEKAEIRAAKIYLETYFASRDEGKESYQAHLAANNDLKRAHLARVENSGTDAMNSRYVEMDAMEDAIRVEIRKNLSAYELEQLELLEEQEKALKKNKSK